MRKTILLLVLLGHLAPTCYGASASEPKKETLLAVMDILNNTGEFSAFVDGMPDMLITELMQSGDIKLVERTKVQTAMKALKLETSGLTQERNLELGKWLGVDGILFGAFNRAGERYRLDVRAIDVQTGKITVAASATCGKQNLLDLIPEIGKQLLMRISAADQGKVHPKVSALSIPATVSKPVIDSCPLEIQYEMHVSLLSESGIPHQRVRIYLNNDLLGVSNVVDELNRNFVVFKGNVSVGNHTLTLVHGTVDKQGRWIRELKDQPDPFAFAITKQDRPIVQYRMFAHENYFSFKEFTINYHNHHNNGD